MSTKAGAADSGSPWGSRSRRRMARRRGVRNIVSGQPPCSPVAWSAAHVDLVDVWPLLAVDLDVHVALVHHRSGIGVLEALVRHHVAPVARRVTDGEQDRPIAPLRLSPARRRSTATSRQGLCACCRRYGLASRLSLFAVFMEHPSARVRRYDCSAFFGPATLRGCGDSCQRAGRPRCRRSVRRTRPRAAPRQLASFAVFGRRIRARSRACGPVPRAGERDRGGRGGAALPRRTGADRPHSRGLPNAPASSPGRGRRVYPARRPLSGGMDLTEAEGVADLIEARTEAERRRAIRLARRSPVRGCGGMARKACRAVGRAGGGDRLRGRGRRREPRCRRAGSGGHRAGRSDYRCFWSQARGRPKLTDGFDIVLIGPPNAGKSSLLNALTARGRRDRLGRLRGRHATIVSVTIELAGYRVTLHDTAGIRDDATGRRGGRDRANEGAAREGGSGGRDPEPGHASARVWRRHRSSSTTSRILRPGVGVATVDRRHSVDHGASCGARICSPIVDGSG